MTAQQKYNALSDYLTNLECFEDLTALYILVNWTGVLDEVLDYFIRETSEGEYESFEEWAENNL